MTERGAVSDNDIAMERREAQGSSQGPARPGTPTPSKHLGPGSLARQHRPIARPVKGGLANLLAPPGAPSPLWRETEKGNDAPGVANNTGDDVWLFDN